MIYAKSLLNCSKRKEGRSNECQMDSFLLLQTNMATVLLGQCLKQFLLHLLLPAQLSLPV